MNRIKNTEKESQRKLQARELLAHHFHMWVNEWGCVCESYRIIFTLVPSLRRYSRRKKKKKIELYVYVPTIAHYPAHRSTHIAHGGTVGDGRCHVRVAVSAAKENRIELESLYLFLRVLQKAMRRHPASAVAAAAKFKY